MDEPAVGLVVQIHRDVHGSYATWRAAWDRRLRHMKAPGSKVGALSASSWPAAVADGGWGLILLGVPVGTTSMVDRSSSKTKGLSSTTARRETLLSAPLAMQSTSPITVRRSSAELMAMETVSVLIGWTPDLVAPRLAPPVLEWVTADARRALHRAVVTWDLSWPLSAPQLECPAGGDRSTQRSS
jgi:hypothetical protein